MVRVVGVSHPVQEGAQLSLCGILCIGADVFVQLSVAASSRSRELPEREHFTLAVQYCVGLPQEHLIVRNIPFSRWWEQVCALCSLPKWRAADHRGIQREYAVL